MRYTYFHEQTVLRIIAQLVSEAHHMFLQNTKKRLILFENATFAIQKGGRCPTYTTSYHLSVIPCKHGQLLTDHFKGFHAKMC